MGCCQTPGRVVLIEYISYFLVYFVYFCVTTNNANNTVSFRTKSLILLFGWASIRKDPVQYFWMHKIYLAEVYEIYNVYLVLWVYKIYVFFCTKHLYHKGYTPFYILDINFAYNDAIRKVLVGRKNFHKAAKTILRHSIVCLRF